MPEETSEKGRGGHRHRLLYNNDRGFLYYLPPSTDVEGIIQEFVGRLRGTQIDTLLARIDRGNLVPMFDSRIEGKVGKGQTTFPTVEIWRHIVGLRKMYDQGIDPYALVFEATREAGLSAFTTIRMNDLHHTKVKHAFTTWDSFYISDIARNSDFYIGEDYGHYAEPGSYNMASRLLNFIHDEVREHRLAIIEEIIERYDLDGFELDFQRHGLYFAKSDVEKGTPLMTDMIRQVRAIFDKFEKERGHPINLMVRVPSWLELSGRMGLDLSTWVREGLVDIVAASPVAQTELDAPVEDYVKLAEDTPCEIMGTIEYIPQPPYGSWIPEMGRAAAAWFHHCGVDGIYFENDHMHYMPYTDISNGKPRLVNPSEHLALHSQLHDPEIIRLKSKRYAISALNKDWPSFPKQLPTSWKRTGRRVAKTYRIKIADDMKRAVQSGWLESVHLRLIISAMCEEDGFEVSFNGNTLNHKDALLRNLRGSVHCLGDDILIRYDLRPEWVVVGGNTVDLTLVKVNKSIVDPIILFGIEVDCNYRVAPLKQFGHV